MRILAYPNDQKTIPQKKKDLTSQRLEGPEWQVRNVDWLLNKEELPFKASVRQIKTSIAEITRAR